MRLVIDTNIIISFLISNSTRRYILMNSNIEFIAPEYTFTEILKHADIIMKDIDPDDAPFLALAIKTKVDGIWSEDKGFQEQNHVKVYTTKQLLELL
ncbi:MAG: PIN domain-containing protein [Candidatus Methanoperedens sp.]|nr:PIN domain-containing protein [Candidatus Methanoperedens sp.]